jgi:hypothetical protein
MMITAEHHVGVNQDFRSVPSLPSWLKAFLTYPDQMAMSDNVSIVQEDREDQKRRAGELR